MRNRLLTVITMLGFGCATAPVPTEQLERSAAAVANAEEMTPGASVRAQQYAQVARQQLEDAQQHLEDGDNDGAKNLALRAHQDAELSVVLARSDHARRRTAQLMRSARSLSADDAPVETSGGDQTEN